MATEINALKFNGSKLIPMGHTCPADAGANGTVFHTRMTLFCTSALYTYSNSRVETLTSYPVIQDP